MKGPKVTAAPRNGQPRWILVGLIAVVVAVLFFLPYLGIICISALFAYIFYPIFKFYSKRIPTGLAATLTMVTSLVVLALPIGLILFTTVSQGIQLASSLAAAASDPNSDLHKAATDFVHSLNSWLAPVNNGQAVLTQAQFQSFIGEVLPGVIQGLANSLIGFLSSIPTLFTSIIVYAFLFSVFTVHGKSIINNLNMLSPFDDSTSDLYVERAATTVSVSLKGQFIISFATALASCLLLFLLDLQQYFFFFLIIFTILGMVPLGAGVIMIPLCIIYMLFVDFWGGFWALIIFVFGVCNIDTVLRPIVMSKSTGLIPALTVLSTFCGIYYFGLLGIIYGPLITVLLITTFNIYKQFQIQQRAS